jgi:hypothetical protein
MHSPVDTADLGFNVGDGGGDLRVRFELRGDGGDNPGETRLFVPGPGQAPHDEYELSMHVAAQPPVPASHERAGPAAEGGVNLLGAVGAAARACARAWHGALRCLQGVRRGT